MSSICTDLAIITKVLKTSKFLEVDKDEKLVRRTAPLPEEPDTDQRTLTLLGVSKESTIDSITKQFSKYGNVNCVRIIKDKKTKEPTGVVSIEFSTIDEAKKLIENSKDIEGVTIQSKEEFFSDKKKKIKNRKRKL